MGLSLFSRAGALLALSLIWVYRHCISCLMPPTCRFQPTCSAYAREAIVRFGCIKGGALTVWRILRCHPFYKGPLVDPVPFPRNPLEKHL